MIKIVYLIYGILIGLFIALFLFFNEIKKRMSAHNFIRLIKILLEDM